MTKSTKNHNCCYARALPTDGSHGGQAWGSNKSSAEFSAMQACRIYSSQTGGNPDTCRIVESHCNKDYPTIARLLPDEKDSNATKTAFVAGDEYTVDGSGTSTTPFIPGGAGDDYPDDGSDTSTTPFIPGGAG